MRLSTAYWESQTLLTANRIGLFEVLAGGAKSVEEIAAALGTRPRPTRLLLKACVALQCLEEDARGFRNSAMSEAFLVPGSPGFLGNGLRYTDNLYGAWGQLEQALREDRPPMQAETYLGEDREQTRDFVYAMHGRALGIGKALVGLVDLSGRTQMLDVGGGPGTYSALFSQRYSGLRAQVLELPEVAALASEILSAMGAEEQVSLLSGDYHQTPFPENNDVVLISGVLHRETPKNCRALIKRGFDSLKPEGLMVISDVFTDEGGTAPLFATLFGLNMMLTAPDGCVHADADVAGWMTDAGLADVEVKPFPPPMPHRVVLGRKG
jgi:predicted O-methyltransferase YrrM